MRVDFDPDVFPKAIESGLLWFTIVGMAALIIVAVGGADPLLAVPLILK